MFKDSTDPKSFLESFLTESRKKRIAEVAAERTRWVLPVLEGIYDQGNTNAVLRTCDGLGILSVEVIETSQNFKVANRISQGASGWLEVQKRSSTRECFESLRSRGYRIAVSSLEEPSDDLEGLDLSQPLALVFGNEKQGCSREAHALADCRFKIPMVGMSQSYNISVAAALALYSTLRKARDQIPPEKLKLHAEDLHALELRYCLKSIPFADKLNFPPQPSKHSTPFA